MSAPNAKAVAIDVSETLRKKHQLNLGKILRKNGYSLSTSKRPKIVTETKAYQEEIAPIVEAMVVERDRAIKAMKKKISKAKYRDLTDSLDKLTKNIQLLSGGSTENNSIIIAWQ